MSATDIQRCHSSPPRWMRPPQPTTSGASAISGTVWLSTTHGTSADSASRERCMSAASSSPPTAPTSQPASATRSVNQQALSIAVRTVGDPAALVSGCSTRPATSHTCGMARSSVRGSRLAPPTCPPASGTTTLTSSHSAASSRSARTPTTTRRPTPERSRGRTGTGAVRSGASVVGQIGHAVATTGVASAGMTCSPYTRIVSSLLSCWR